MANKYLLSTVFLLLFTISFSLPSEKDLLECVNEKNKMIDFMNLCQKDAGDCRSRLNAMKTIYRTKADIEALTYEMLEYYRKGEIIALQLRDKVYRYA